jgi:hypothetical protein
LCNARDAGVYLLNQEGYGLDPGKALIRPAPIAVSLWNQHSASVLFAESPCKNIHRKDAFKGRFTESVSLTQRGFFFILMANSFSKGRR